MTKGRKVIWWQLDFEGMQQFGGQISNARGGYPSNRELGEDEDFLGKKEVENFFPVNHAWSLFSKLHDLK